MGWQQSVLHPRCFTLGWELTSTLEGNWVRVVPDWRGEGTECLHWIRTPFIGCITCTIEHAMRAQMGSRGIPLLFFLTFVLDGGVGGQHNALAALSLGNTRYPLYRSLCGLQGWSGWVWKISPPPSTRIWSLEHPASSDLLHWLCYPGPLTIGIFT